MSVESHPEMRISDPRLCEVRLCEAVPTLCTLGRACSTHAAFDTAEGVQRHRWTASRARDPGSSYKSSYLKALKLGQFGKSSCRERCRAFSRREKDAKSGRSAHTMRFVGIRG